MDKEILKIVADNPTLQSALRRLFEDKFSTDNLKSTDADAVLGQLVRARLVGLEKINEAFKEIEKYKSTQKSGDKVNPGK